MKLAFRFLFPVLILFLTSCGSDDADAVIDQILPSSGDGTFTVDQDDYDWNVALLSFARAIQTSRHI